ncbi:hypothetical protein HS088_TW05G00079 [Tripterygium wilfordii]|uniref:DUF4057 domain-containing protein n=1 Tax=Tripterygium wilfordii TaxID=458696 RepID=A0A7J7DM12_TRIWF|nr:hypothetical protein HS088_TW05G00079 [Tripterygium wilfordii]
MAVVAISTISIAFCHLSSSRTVFSVILRKPCSGYKWKEMTGSGIFAANGEDDTSDSAATSPNNRTNVLGYQVPWFNCQQAINGISQISFNSEESISPKKPTSIPEVAKQRELSDAKIKEISGHDIFGPPTESVPQSLVAARSLESKEAKDLGEPAPRNPAGGQTSILFSEEPVIKTAKKIHDQKFAELTGNNIFKGDVPPGSAEKPLSTAKLREVSGNDIFADGKAESRDYFGGVRQPPGGESSIALV